MRNSSDNSPTEFDRRRNERFAAPAASDKQLLERIAAGEREPFNELNRRYQQKAHDEAYRVLGNDADAWEAVQEAFLKFYRSLDQFEGRSCFWTWLKKVVRNAARDIQRKQSRRRAHERAFAHARPSGKAFTMFDTLLVEEFQQWLKQRVEPPIALICKLLVQEHPTNTEIATRIGTTVWHVRQAILTLRIKLREYLADGSVQSGERPLPRSR